MQSYYLIDFLQDLSKIILLTVWLSSDPGLDEIFSCGARLYCTGRRSNKYRPRSALIDFWLMFRPINQSNLIPSLWCNVQVESLYGASPSRTSSTAGWGWWGGDWSAWPTLARLTNCFNYILFSVTEPEPKLAILATSPEPKYGSVFIFLFSCLLKFY